MYEHFDKNDGKVPLAYDPIKSIATEGYLLCIYRYRGTGRIAWNLFPIYGIHLPIPLNRIPARIGEFAEREIAFLNIK